MELAESFPVCIQEGKCLKSLENEFVDVLTLLEIERDKAILRRADCIKESSDRDGVVCQIFLQNDELYVRPFLLYSYGEILNEVWMRDLNQSLLHVLNDCYRIVIIQRVDDAQVVSLRRFAAFTWLDGRVSYAIHLEVVPLENVLCVESTLEKRHSLVLNRNVVSTLESGD